MNTFGELKNSVAKHIKDPSTSRQTLAGTYINYIYETIWNSHLWKDAIIFDEPVSIYANNPIFALPSTIQKPLAITNRAISSMVTSYSLQEFLTRFLSGISTTGAITGYSAAGNRGVLKDLSAAGTIKVVSDSTSDTADVLVIGRDANGSKKVETLILNGTTAVAGTVTFTHIDSFVVQNQTVGTVTLTDSSDNVLDRLDFDAKCNSHKLYRLGYIPDEDGLLYVTGKKRFVPMINDYDCPQIPVSSALFHGGLAGLLREAGKYNQAQDEDVKMAQALDSIISSEDIMIDTPTCATPEIRINRDDCEL